MLGDGGAFLEPAPPGWPGQAELEQPFRGPLPLKKLALRWGAGRLPGLRERALKRRELGPWKAADGADPSQPAEARAWEAAGPIDSRTFNDLRLDLCHRSVGLAALVRS